MTSTPLPRPGDDEAYLRTKLEEMQAALHREDGAKVLETLKHLTAEYSADFANRLLAGLLEVAVADIAAKVRAGDPLAIAYAQRMLLPMED